MAGPKCIINNAACVVPDTKDIPIFQVRESDRYFGIWVPQQYLYALNEDQQNLIWAWVDRHDRGHIDVRKTTEKLNKLRWEYGFNVLSLGPDDFFDQSQNWRPFLLLEAFNNSDWEWKDVFLGLGNGCLDWAIQGIRLIREYTHNQRFFAIGIDEPLLTSKSHAEKGQTATNYQWCLEHSYSESLIWPPRLSQIADEVHKNGDVFYISDYLRVEPLESRESRALIRPYGLSYSNDSLWADGLIFNGYEDFTLVPNNPASSLPLYSWGLLKAFTVIHGLDFGVWIANSCTQNWYEHERIWLEKVACQKDYFNTLFSMIQSLEVKRVFLYPGDLAPELAQALGFARTTGPGRTRRTGPPPRPQPEPELTDELWDAIHRSRIQPSWNNGWLLLDNSRAFFDYVNTVFWRRLDQLRLAALEEHYLEHSIRRNVPTGRYRYCTDGPRKNINGYSVIDCLNCTTWDTHLPRDIQFCPPDLPTGQIGYFLHGVTPGSGQILPQGQPAYGFPINPSASVLASQTSIAVSDDDGAIKHHDGDDVGIPKSARKYTIIYLIR